MSWVTASYGYWEFWAPRDPVNETYGPQKCIFDGENKLIFVNPEESTISIKEDVYSGWKEWAAVRDNSKYLPAIRTTGGDPIPGTSQFTGDSYFLINGWRFLIDHSLDIDGVIFSDDYPSPFIEIAGTQIVTNKVSSLVQTVTTESIGGITVPTVQQIRQEIDDYSTKLLAINTKVQTLTNSPSVTQIRDELDTNSAKLASINTKVQTLTNGPTATEIRQEVDNNSTKLSSINTKVQSLSNGPTATQIREEVDNNSTKLAAIKAKTDTITTSPSAADIADAVRTELTPELSHLLTLQNGQGLDSTQATMLLEIYRLYGLDPTKPLIVTQTSRTAGTISQNIATNQSQTVVTRV